MENDNKELKQEQNTIECIKSMVETELKEILDIGIQRDNIDDIGKLIDIHKDIENEEYWKVKKEVYNMRYSSHDYNDNMGNYGRRGVPGTGRGRYRGTYGAEEELERMHEHYGNYSAANESANRGNYGAEDDMLMSLDYMLKSACKFMDMLEDDAHSPEAKHMIKEYRRKIGEK